MIIDRKKWRSIPAPKPPGMGPEDERIWNQAWRLADFIDDPAAAPLAERKARLPELLLMRDRMAKIEQQGGTDSTPTEDKPPDYCPARCKRTGKCYGGVWFTEDRLSDIVSPSYKQMLRRGMVHRETWQTPKSAV